MNEQQLQTRLFDLSQEVDELERRKAHLAAEVVVLADEMVLQEAGVYRYQHRLNTSAQFKPELDKLSASITSAMKAGLAVQGATNWTVNGSANEGLRMVNEMCKLMLRSYNNEVENIIRTLKPYNVDRSIERLEKTKNTISRLGKTMSVSVTDYFHQLRCFEIRLTSDYLAKVAEEKEREREERARLREEEVVRREIEREQARLEKERHHYQSAMQALIAAGDPDAEKLQKLLASVEASLAEVEERAANVRAGYVYVISNVGAFGEEVVKIGMTRRLDPMDRVRELGDASVPFTFDVHALIFSQDAVGLESRLHSQFADRRVNRVNLRREFFYATPAEVRDALAAIDSAFLLSFDERPTAFEWLQSEGIRDSEDRLG
jgi:hypothetical protein